MRDQRTILARIERVRQIMLNAEDVTFDIGDQAPLMVTRESAPKVLPQMPQMPQGQACSGQVLSIEEDSFEERAAIIEYDGGMPRRLAEFLARRPGQR